MTDDLTPARPLDWLEETLMADEAAKFLKLTPEQLQALRTEGTGPRFQKLGKRSVRYVRRHLIAWRDASGHQSTAEYRTAQLAEGAPESTDASKGGA